MDLTVYSQSTEKALTEPFEWCFVKGGEVALEDASDRGGTQGGVYTVNDFAIAKYLVTNSHYERFVVHENGYANSDWWSFSPEALQWRTTRSRAQATAFSGKDLPRTRISWFECMAFCAWLSELLHSSSSFDITSVATWSICLPTEQEWQRAALGDTQGHYPWGSALLDETRANCNNWVGQPTSVKNYPLGASPSGVFDMIGNLSEWCVTGWGTDNTEVTGYGYRNIRGGAWNVSIEDDIRPKDRLGHPPRGRLNDFGLYRLLAHHSLEPTPRVYSKVWISCCLKNCSRCSAWCATLQKQKLNPSLAT
jgi:formylglycine-generating enzyme required for sulfatase activity